RPAVVPAPAAVSGLPTLRRARDPSRGARRADGAVRGRGPSAAGRRRRTRVRLPSPGPPRRARPRRVAEDGRLPGGDAPDRGRPPVSGPSPADQRGGGRGEGDGPAGADRSVRRADPPRSPALRAGGRGTPQRGRAGRAGGEL